MLPEERRERIVTLVNDYNGCSVEELAERTDCSEATVRRDLQQLADRNLLKRTHGGAMPAVKRGQPYDNRRIQNREEKAAIGERGAREVHEGQIVIFDSGSTPLEVAKRVPEEFPVTPVTPMPTIAHVLARKGLGVHLTGGIYRGENHTSAGPWAEERIQQMNVDLLVLGTDGIDERGLTARNVHQSRLKEIMIRTAERVVLVSDHSKFNGDHPFRFAGLETIDLCITDQPIPESLREGFRTGDVDLVEDA